MHDPNNSVRSGDILRFQQFPCDTPSKRIRHMVTEILSACGPRLDERPPLMTPEEQQRRLDEVEERQDLRRRKRIDAKEESARRLEENRLIARQTWAERQARKKAAVEMEEHKGGVGVEVSW